ncbi:MAG TPA: hypothetical protein VMT37_04640 [Solirubrobacterales bacterium]|nr:hypothetical protein [Solirubrobacterales bacterium]
MGVVPIVLVILAMKIPIFGLLWLVWWAGRAPEVEGPAEEPVPDRRPLPPLPPLPRRPRRRGPHGGTAARPTPGARQRTEPHAAAAALSRAAAGSETGET